ncbi:MAG: hypothetical protein IJ859_08800 [Synergistaceae bacterium]|nr:hypothetical protein [Synergistaceae bacterium]
MFLEERPISDEIKQEARRRAVGVPVEVMEVILQYRADKRAGKIAKDENSYRY